MALNLDTLGLSGTVTAEGISAPDYQTILDTLTSYFQQIYGSDAYLEPDSKDGQMVALVALPPHSISAIVDGGDITEIAQTIRGNKGQGTATYGTTSVTVPDTYGNPHVISFSRSTDVPIYGHITLKAFTGYTSQIGLQIQQAVAGYINGLTIGDSVLLSRIYSPANLGVVSGGSARFYDIQELLIGKSAGTVAAANVNIAYNESASCKPENIALTVTS